MTNRVVVPGTKPNKDDPVYNGRKTGNETLSPAARPTDVKQLAIIAMLSIATMGATQSVHFEMPQRRVQYQTVFQTYAPNTEVTGVSIIRSQKDLNAYWAALHGRSYVKNMVAPRRYDFKKEQLIAIVLPQRIGFSAIPQIDRISTGPYGVWRIDVSPKPGTGFQGANRWVPYVIVRTPLGSDDLDIVLHGSQGDMVLSTRSKPKTRQRAGKRG